MKDVSQASAAARPHNQRGALTPSLTEPDNARRRRKRTALRATATLRPQSGTHDDS
jgi:hypothetical protein